MLHSALGSFAAHLSPLISVPPRCELPVREWLHLDASSPQQIGGAAGFPPAAAALVLECNVYDASH